MTRGRYSQLQAIGIEVQLSYFVFLQKLIY